MMKNFKLLFLFLQLLSLPFVFSESLEKVCIVGEEKPVRLTLSVVLGNEADHYLKPFLDHVRQYITDAVIIDDATTDDTIQICKEKLKGIPISIIRNEKSKFANEIELRKQQWEETVKTSPDWILFLDADQIFEDKFKEEVKELIQTKDVDVYCFRLYDFWDEQHYREDAYWCAHLHPRPFLVRYKAGIHYKWKETPQHCGSFPITVLSFPMKASDLRLKHYGWAKKEDRPAKYKRYQKLDPGAVYGWKEQYESILDEHPHLVEWVE